MNTRLVWALALVVAMLACLACPVGRADAPAGGTDPALPGVDFVDQLAKGDFAGAEGKLDATMKGALPEEKLGATWKALVKQAGAFQKRLRARVTEQAGYKIVLVTCQFEKTALDAKVVFNGKGEVAGLFFVPAAPEGGFKTPAYAQADAYTEKEVTVGKGEWALPGTLTMPKGAKGKVAAVVLVQGSGPNDRDETVGANKPFRDLAWGLATRGIAVLRYEKRTRQYAAKLGAGSLAGFTVKEETIDDALAATEALRGTEGIDRQRIFVVGHSLGAMVAPRIGQADPHLAGLILMAAPARPFEDLLVEQTRYLLTLGGPLAQEDEAKVAAMTADAAKIKKLAAADAGSATLIQGAPPSYWLDLRAHDPIAIAKTLQQPMLILQGGRDYQVTADDFENWKKGLGAAPTVTYRMYPKLNHLFSAGSGKSRPSEYEVAGNVDESVVRDTADWIEKTPPAP